MPNSQDELSKEEKITRLKSLVANEDAFSNNQPIYEAHLADPDPEVRSLAIKGLWDYPDPGLIDTLMDIAQRDPDQQVRNRAVMALGRYVYEGEMADYDFDWGSLEDVMREDELPEADFRRVVSFLLDIARDPSAAPEPQRFAIEALGFSSATEIADVIEQAYHSPHVELKVSALFAMGRSGLTRWNSYILAEIDNPDPRLQFEAVRSAGELFLDEAMPSLLDLARVASDETLRREAIWALGHMESLEAWDLLDEIVNDPTEDEETREIAEAALDEFYMFQEMAEADFEVGEDDEFTEAEDDGVNGRFQ